MLDILEVNAGYEVKFQYKPFLVDAIKKIPGARFNGAKKHWWIPSSSGPALLNWAGNFSNARVKTSASQTEIEIGEIDPLPELTVDIPLKRTLFPYQANGVAYNIAHERTIVGDEPGLGKTGQSIATAEAVGAKCILIICPATLKENWKIEIEEKWTDSKAVILSDRVKSSWPQYYRVGLAKYFIVNYESLKKFFVERIDVPEGKPMRLNHIKFKDTINLFDMVIIDEVHRCKDGKRQQSKFVMGIAKGKQFRLALTGTPVLNKPSDLIPQLAIIGQLEKFGNYKGFMDRYCAGMNGSSNLKELNYLLNKHCFYRREKKEVLKDLPDKIRTVVRVEITNRAEYTKTENNFIDYLRDNLKKSEGEINTALRSEVMVQIGILKKVAARGKIEAMIESVREVTEAGEKIVLFAWHKEIVQELKLAYPDALTIVGDDKVEVRQQNVERFQNDPSVKVIICNIKSGGVGITLTASSRVSFIELPWTAADSDQCEDRCHRIGQHDSVEVKYLLGHETIDEYIYDIIQKKRELAGAVTGAETTIETNVVDEFINLFSEDKF